MVRATTFLAGALLLGGCQSGKVAPEGNGTTTADALMPLMTNEAMVPESSGKHAPPDDRWTVPVPGGTLDIGVDTVGSAGAEEHTAKESRAMAEEPDDGFPDYTISVLNHSPQPVRINWRTSGEGRNPVDAQDMGTLSAAGPELNGRLPSGILAVASDRVREINLWAVQDHRPEPCEGFRVSLFDAATGAPLLDDHRRPLVAHSVVREQFDPHHPGASECQ